MIEISKELSKHWNILLTEEDIADAYKNSNRHESDCFVLATIYNTEVQLNISNLQLIDGVLYADINEVEGLPMNIVKVDVEGGHLIAYYREGIGQMSRIDLGSVVGPKGDTGAMPNISVGEVVTGAPGSNANVSITGTEEDPVLNFTIPRGAIGEVSEAELSKKLNEKADVISGTVSGDIVTFDGNGGDLLSCVANIEPIQSGTGDPSPTNIRPISGRTGLTVKRCGRNLGNITLASIADADIGEGSYTVSGLTFSFTKVSDNGVSEIVVNGTPTARVTSMLNRNLLVDMPPGRYILSGCPSGGALNKYRLTCWDNTTSATVANDFGSGATFELVEGHNVNFAIDISQSMAGQTISNLVFKPMIRPESDSNDAYEPYNGTSFPITWQTQAGTIYGGTLNVTTGVLTVTHGAVQIKDKTWTYDSTYTRFSSSFATDDIAIAPTRTQKLVCDAFAPVTQDSGIANVPNNSIYNGGTNRILYVKTDTVNTAANFVSTYGEYHIVFPLATPQTYQLTPTEVRTILGGNTIYTDGGTIIAEYPADTEKYIDNSITNVKRLIAGIETDYIATKNYAVGDFLVVKNEFLKVVSAIANGEGIVVGQNVSATTVAEQLILLFNS